MANQSNGHNDNVQLKYQWVYRQGQFVFQIEKCCSLRLK